MVEITLARIWGVSSLHRVTLSVTALLDVSRKEDGRQADWFQTGSTSQGSTLFNRSAGLWKPLCDRGSEMAEHLARRDRVIYLVACSLSATQTSRATSSALLLSESRF